MAYNERKKYNFVKHTLFVLRLHQYLSTDPSSISYISQVKHGSGVFNKVLYLHCHHRYKCAVFKRLCHTHSYIIMSVSVVYMSALTMFVTIACYTQSLSPLCIKLIVK